jgi:superfamily II RNA helicase
VSEIQRPQRPKRRRDSNTRSAPDAHDARDTRDKRAPVPAGGPSSSSPTASAAFSPAAAAQVEEFAATQPFPLDPFQIEAARHLAEGRSVLVAAPTGMGKTVVAEYAIWQSRRAGLRAIYTAPLKALSNQKFRDLRARYGEAEVGLLTGDIVENPRAPIVVMTTEIFRNMLLEGARAAQLTVSQEVAVLLHSTTARDAGTLPPADDIAELARQSQLDEELSTVGCVVFDELHYLSDPSRGPVWEEAIIHSPAHVVFVGLSATVSNADELRRWIERVHGPMSLVWHDERAVPLEHYYLLDGKLHLVQDAEGRRVDYFPDIGGEAKLARMRNRQRRFTFGGEDDEPPARITYTSGSVAAERERGRRERTSAHPTGSPARPSEQDQPAQPEEPKERLAPEPGEVITALSHASLLPCIYFLPGRRAVETAAESARGHLLVSPAQRARLHDEVQQWVRALPHEDQRLDQVQRLAALLPRGLAFHHAGLLPGLKVMVETLFQRGELRAVFATDTLALGINMPARSVVLGSMSKFDGTQMRLLTPNEYQQLTGRAGRRGLDQKGAAVIPYSPWDAFEPGFALLTGPLLPVTSAFTIRYNTILNLWRPGDANRLRVAIAASFREFQRRAGRYERDAGDKASATDGGRRRGRAAQRHEPHLLSRAAAAELNGTIYTLRSLGYIGQDDELTVKGRLLRAVFHPAGIILAELLVTGALDGLAPAELAEVVSWFTFDDDRPLRNFDQLSQRLVQVRRDVYTAQRRVLETEYEEGLALSPGIVDAFHGVALNWSRGYSLGGMLRRIDLAEGDLLVTLNQTIDLLQQVHGAVAQVLDAPDLWQSARPDTRRARYLADVRARLTRLRPGLDAAWRGMLRGSVAQSRAIPSMATPAAATPAISIPPIPMAEDEEPDVARSDCVPDGSPRTADAVDNADPVDDAVVSTNKSERDGSAHDRDTPPRGG